MKQAQLKMAHARALWGDWVIRISKTYEDRGFEAATADAESFIDTLYLYGDQPVLFKPTSASGKKTFRSTREGAVSYFVGNNPEYPLDSGFTSTRWLNWEATEAASFADGATFMWMGSMVFEGYGGKTAHVDKSWVYFEDNDGNLRIALHHSSLPYIP